jgi:hypothetical protein
MHLRGKALEHQRQRAGADHCSKKDRPAAQQDAAAEAAPTQAQAQAMQDGQRQYGKRQQMTSAIYACRREESVSEK